MILKLDNIKNISIEDKIYSNYKFLFEKFKLSN